MPDPKKFPVVKPGTGPSFDNLDDAANEVSKGFGTQPNIEQSAALFKGSDGKYSYSEAVTNSEHDNFGMRVQLPQGTTLAGVVHSHPGQDERAKYFSPGDLNTANQLKIPSYIRFLSDNSIRKYTPGQTSVSFLKGFDTRVSSGDPVKLSPPPPDNPVLVRNNDTTDPTQQ